jgi:hypothetical protein
MYPPHMLITVISICKDLQAKPANMRATGSAIYMIAAFILLYVRVTCGTIFEPQLFLCFEKLCHASRLVSLVLRASFSWMRDVAVRTSCCRAFSAGKDWWDARCWLGDVINLGAFGGWTVAQLVLVSAHKRRERGLQDTFKYL